MPSSNHCSYGLAVATSRLTSASSTITPRSRSTRKSLPGCRRPLRLILLAGTSITPVSEPSTTQPSVVSSQRPGRRPLRSSVAPITRPSVNVTAAGPSHGSMRHDVVGVERLQLLGDVVPVGVGLRDHHHHRVRQAAAGQREQLEHVVERGGVAAAGAHDREHLLQVVAEQLGGELRLARPHPVDVAAHRVDLAVVGDHPERVGELPARERVRGEARVHERERGLRARVLQVGVVAEQLRAGQHALVDDRAAAEARDHELRAGGELGHAADHVELALERVLVARELVGGGHDELLDVRRVEVGRDADVVLVDRARRASR